ncbi:hypothetical protein [Bacillus massiliigorillae]|uniref:hypothetical protein n=1 Tax=Bacillus massiliigorillae TaxID=1243664 RepID=UPI0003A2F9BB|nr:hypothetical protein [Bacillus massiliigorillae]
MKLSIFPLILSCLISIGCSVQNENDEIKGEFNLEGKVIELDTNNNRLLLDESSNGHTWVTLPEHDTITRYEKNDSIVVWVKAMNASKSDKTEALNIEFQPPKKD